MENIFDRRKISEVDIFNKTVLSQTRASYNAQRSSLVDGGSRQGSSNMFISSIYKPDAKIKKSLTRPIS